MQANDTYATGGGNTWNWNQPMVMHTNGTSILTGTSYPGLFGTNHLIILIKINKKKLLKNK